MQLRPRPRGEAPVFMNQAGVQSRSADLPTRHACNTQLENSRGRGRSEPMSPVCVCNLSHGGRLLVEVCGLIFPVYARLSIACLMSTDEMPRGNKRRLAQRWPDTWCCTSIRCGQMVRKCGHLCSLVSDRRLTHNPEVNYARFCAASGLVTAPRRIPDPDPSVINRELTPSPLLRGGHRPKSLV